MPATIRLACAALVCALASVAHAAPLSWEWLPGKRADPTAPKTTVAGLPRSFVDRPDQVTGSQMHVMYVLPSDGIDEQLDVNGTIGTSVLAFNLWLLDQTPNRWLRLDTYQDLPDI